MPIAVVPHHILISTWTENTWIANSMISIYDSLWCMALGTRVCALCQEARIGEHCPTFHHLKLLKIDITQIKQEGNLHLLCNLFNCFLADPVDIADGHSWKVNFGDRIGGRLH